jgi:uncharacterized protein DUF6457
VSPESTTDPLNQFVADLADALGIDLDVDKKLLLAVAREAAHNVMRPAAPLATFLVGYAAGARGGGSSDVLDAAETATRVAQAAPAQATDDT